MPNWVANNLIIHGENAVDVLRSLLKENKDNDSDCGYDFDFNKIIPMPESLMIESGSITDECIELYMTSKNLLVDYYGKDKFSTKKFMHIEDKLNQSKRFSTYNLRLSQNEIDSLLNSLSKYFGTLDFEQRSLNRGKIAVENLINYGSKDWYDWSCEHWGTKWNACRTQIPDDEAADVYFDTAWSPVTELIRELSEQHPDCSFEYSYAEEQAGNFAGTLIFQNGEIIDGSEYDSDSKEAYETFFELWGCEDEFKFNEKTGTYEYIEDEEEM